MRLRELAHDAHKLAGNMKRLQNGSSTKSKKERPHERLCEPLHFAIVILWIARLAAFAGERDKRLTRPGPSESA
jgi:hypothetical protein